MELNNLVIAYLNNALPYYSMESSFLSSREVGVSSNDSATCCSSGWGRYRISLGSLFYSTMRKVKPKYSIPADKVELIYTDISHMYDAVFYHELGHILYTPLSEFSSIAESLHRQGANNFSSLLLNVSNIVEDVVIEGEIKALRPHTTDSINHLRKVVFSKLPEVLTEDLSGALNVMLHNYRTLNSTKVVYPNKDINRMLMSYMFLCVNTPNPILRLDRVIAFTAVLWDVFNCKEPIHYTNFKKGLGSSFYSTIPDKYKDKPEDDTPNDSPEYVSSMQDSRVLSSEPEEANSSTPSPSSSEVEEEIQEEVDKANSSKSSLVSPEPIDKPDKRKVIQESMEEVKPTLQTSGHMYMDASKEDTSRFSVDYSSIVSKYSYMISKIYSIIKKRRNWNTSKWEEGKVVGKLNEKSFYKRTHKIYKQRTGVQREADLAISILVDNSGSMMGEKSRICGEALIVLAEVCNKLRIPFEVNAFTEGSSCITIGLKPFDKDFNSVKTNLALMATNSMLPDKYCMYGGNKDEINLKFLWHKFRKRKEKDKILIVISDGQTTGSRDVLAETVRKIIKDGITVLGLGIKSTAVLESYPVCKVFNSSHDLEELPRFLTHYLEEKIFNKEVN